LTMKRLSINYGRFTRRQRTIAVKNSRVMRLCNGRSLRIGTSSRLANANGLLATSAWNRPIVIWFRPPAHSLNLVAPSVLKSDLQRMRAFSLKKRCAQGKIENRCLKHVLPDIHADDAGGSALGHLDRVITFAAAEVYNLPTRDLGEEAVGH
jgi:hypothetical protein